MTTAKSARVNARLSASSARKLAYLQKARGLSATEVIQRAIDRYHEAATDERASPAEILARAGFIGCADGPVDLSSGYKSDLSTSLQKKT
jgi:hypothetical protein